MPPKAKLHSKSGKPKNFPTHARPPVVAAPSTSSETASVADPSAEDAARKFEVELCWCIQHLESTLGNKSLSQKQAQDCASVLQVLKSKTAPLVRKRALMRQHLPDYRERMAKEEKKAKKVNQITFTEPSTSKSTYLRKSNFLTTGDNSFRFNFKVPAEASMESGVEDSAPDSHKNSIRDVVGENVGNINARFQSLSFTNEEFKFNFDIDSGN